MKFLITILVKIILFFMKLFGKDASGAMAGEIHLVRTDDADWKDVNKINSIADSLQGVGFRDAGVYRIEEMPSVLFRVLVNEATYTGGIVVQMGDSIHCDVYCKYEDGGSLTFSNAAMGGYLDQMPENVNIYDKQADGPKLFERLLNERKPGPYVLITENNFASLYEEAYAMEMAWRRNKGVSRDEVKRLADGTGRKVSDDILDVVAENATMNMKLARQAEYSAEEYERYYDAKQTALERVLGKMYDTVGHAVIPFQLGGALDMYFFPDSGIKGTAFATMELIEPNGTGPVPNNSLGVYEMVAFTRLDIRGATDEDNNPFRIMQGRICSILTAAGRYSYGSIINPGDTCEIPGDEGEQGHCLIFDQYEKSGIVFEIDGKEHCLMLCMEIFKSEMEYAMQHGSAVVLDKLKQTGHYPYSDLKREPVF